MTNLFILDIFFYNGFYSEVLNIISIISIISGILVINNRNPIISILFLICLFLCVSVYLIIIGMNFIGLSYLLVYIGAVSILFLFILMLIDIRISELITPNNNSIVLSIIISIITYSILYSILFNNSSLILDFNNNINYVTSNSWDNNLIENIDIVNIGNIIYTNYSFWLILTSMILLLIMIGAIVLTTK